VILLFRAVGDAFSEGGPLLNEVHLEGRGRIAAQKLYSQRRTAEASAYDGYTQHS
jgi:hypothetical protein